MTGSELTTSRSALVTLTVPAKDLASDPLLSIVASVASPFQTAVKIVKKGDLSLALGPDAAETLTHRNSVLRSLCGMGLHNALDTFGSTPLLFLGGHSARSYAGASPVSALAVAGISSWMSVASSVRDGGAEDAGALLGQLDGYLGSRSFVVPCAEPTLADLDLYLAIVSKVSGEALEGKVKGLANVRRWLEQCGATLEMLQEAAAKNAKMNKIPAATIPKGVSAKPRPLPLFFYGDEDESVVAAAASAVMSAASGGAAKKADKAAGGDGKAPAGAGAGGGGAGGGPTDEQKKAAADKKAKKAAQKAAKQKDQPKKGKGGGNGGAPAAELTVYALDIRVGKIVKAWEHESSDKLWCEEVDLGEESGPRKIASGLRAFYKSKDELEGRLVLVLCNLKARPLGGFPSHGMVLCATNADHTAVEFAVPPEGAVVGERVAFEGYGGEPEPENKIAKKKMFEKLAPDLKTNEDGEVVWRGVRCMAGAGVCRAVNGMKNAQVS